MITFELTARSRFLTNRSPSYAHRHASHPRPHPDRSRFTVPLDYAHPAGEQITVFAREVVAPGKEDASLPWLVFFQGGPGFGGPRPDAASGWLKRALKEFRVLLLDDRGTGRSTPVTHQTLAWRGSPQAQADYVAHFRADNIVADAEFIRRELLGPEGKWSILGQSFGGFCVDALPVGRAGQPA